MVVIIFIILLLLFIYLTIDYILLLSNFYLKRKIITNSKKICILLCKIDSFLPFFDIRNNFLHIFITYPPICVFIYLSVNKVTHHFNNNNKKKKRRKTYIRTYLQKTSPFFFMAFPLILVTTGKRKPYGKCCL